MPQATLSQRSQYITGRLVLGPNEKKPLTDATLEGPDGALTAPPNGLRGWLLKVVSGSVGFAARADATTPFPFTALDDETASDLSGIAIHELNGATAEVAISAIVGGVS